MSRILLVEDEPSIAAGVQDDLELEGYSVDVVTDGVSAATRGVQGQYDLILLDVMLPKKDGFTVCREIRAAGVRTPVIMLTARGQEADKVLGLELGADDYITKPFSRRELQSRVKAALRRGAMSSSQPSEVYEFADLKIDFGRCEVWNNGRSIEVTALELKLLRALLARASGDDRSAQRSRLGKGRLHHKSSGLHAHEQPAEKDRGRSAAAAPSHHGARRRLPV
jgi:two-component system alkaline phosphatase synthesis response regulator PhoP